MALSFLSRPAPTVAQCTPLGCDRPLRGTITAQGAVTCFSFNVSDGEMVEIAFSLTDENEDGQPRWRLVDAAGNAAGACGAYTAVGRQDCGPLAAAGNPYRVEVVDFTSDSGTYLVQLQRLTATETCEVNATSCTIDPSIDSDLLGFNVGGSDAVTVSVAVGAEAGENFEPYWRVLDAFGVPAGRCGAFTLQPTLTCGPLPVAGNPYRIEVTDLFSDDTGDYRISVDGHALCGRPLSQVTLTVGSVQGMAGETVRAQVTLATNAQQVASTENCFAFDSATPVVADDSGQPACNVNPDINKNASSFAFQPSGCRPGDDCEAVCAVVQALDNVAPIPDGAVLYSCSVEIGNDAADDNYPLSCSAAAASDPASNRLDVSCSDGAIEVTSAVCVGDCNGDSQVTVDEIVRGVNIALGNIQLSECPALDHKGDGAVTVDELVAAVSRALNGC